MICENMPCGRAKIATYLPTVPALRYLNCCTMAGWHHCNELYRQDYLKGGVDDLLLMYTVGGMGRMEADGKKYALGQDSMILVPPHTPMKYHTDPRTGEWMFYWLDLTGESMLSVGAKLWQDGCFILSRVPPLYGLFAELLDESSSELQRSALVGQIFDRFISEAVFDASRESSAADHILRYISENYRENIDLRQMSDRFYLSQNQIIRIVRARTGYTPHEYLIRFRLTKACELLQGTQTPVGEIGRIVGYDNNSHFSAAFRGFYGISPTKYRHRFSK